MSTAPLILPNGKILQSPTQLLSTDTHIVDKFDRSDRLLHGDNGWIDGQSIYGSSDLDAFGIVGNTLTMAGGDPYGRQNTFTDTPPIVGLTNNVGHLLAWKPNTGFFDNFEVGLRWVVSNHIGLDSIHQIGPIAHINTSGNFNEVGVGPAWDISLSFFGPGHWYLLNGFHQSPLSDVFNYHDPPTYYVHTGIQSNPDHIPGMGDNWVAMRCRSGQMAGYHNGGRVTGIVSKPAWATSDSHGIHVVHITVPEGMLDGNGDPYASPTVAPVQIKDFYIRSFTGTL